MSSETKNKLARAAQSTQRPAELGDAARDDATRDLLFNAPARDALEAMSIDTRQGTLAGFELPEDILAAVERTGETGAAQAPAPARDEINDPRDASGTQSGNARTTAIARALEAPSGSGAASDELLAVSTDSVSVTALKEAALDAAPGRDDINNSRDASGTQSGDARTTATVRALEAPPGNGAASDEPLAASTGSVSVPALEEAALDVVLAPSSAAVATAIRSVAEARRQCAAQPADKAANARQPAQGAGAASTLAAAGESPTERKVQPGAQPVPETGVFAKVQPRAERGAPAVQFPGTASQASSRSPGAAGPAPDREWARATALADTVDALDGVIADQRRAALGHARRIKWLLSSVMVALLVTIAVGMTQTVLLMRLTRASAAQQERIDDLLRNQQATSLALAGAAASASAGSPAKEAAPADGLAAPLTREAPLARAAAKHAKPQHARKPKTTGAY